MNIKPHKQKYGAKKPYLEKVSKKAQLDPRRKRNTEQLAALVQKYGDITPLFIMKAAMTAAYEDGDVKEAAFFAKDAAPYVHPRLQSTELKGDPNAPLSVSIIDDIGKS